MLGALEAATSVHLLEEVPGVLGRYRFGHALVRQTLLAELSANRRVRLHWAAGQALADLHPEDLTAIAYHLAEGVFAGDPLVAAGWNLKAGRAAMGVAAWDEAAIRFEAAIEMLEHSPVEDARCRYEALMGVSEARQILGGFHTPRRAAREAIALARRCGWRDELVEAAIQAAKFSSLGITPATRSIVEEGLEAIGDRDCLEQVTLTSILAMARGWEPGLSEQEWHDLCGEARAIITRADALGDVRARIDGRSPLSRALSGRGSVRERIAVVNAQREIFDAEYDASGTDIWRAYRVASETGGVAREAGDAELRALGDRRHVEVVRLQDAPWLHRSLLWWTCTEALASGRIDDLDEQVDGLIGSDDRGYEIVHWDLVTRRAFVGGQIDRALEAVSLVVDGGSRYVEMTHQLALFAAAAGDLARARTVSAESWERPMTYGHGRPRALSAAAEAAARLGDHSAAEALPPLLVPYDGTILAPYGGHMVDVSAASALGQVETVLGRFDEAARHFRAGWEIERRMGYDALVARTQVWWARLLLTRGGDGDRNDGERLLALAEATASRCGLGLVLRDVAWTRASLT
jgi:eukaryotic-like serine/threonine-protein kinase